MRSNTPFRIDRLQREPTLDPRQIHADNPRRLNQDEALPHSGEPRRRENAAQFCEERGEEDAATFIDDLKSLHGY
jgi:hypothetical protein